MGQRWKCMIASALLACPAGAVNVAADVTYNNWEVRNEQGCTAASQIIDADSYSAYGDGHNSWRAWRAPGARQLRFRRWLIGLPQCPANEVMDVLQLGYRRR